MERYFERAMLLTFLLLSGCVVVPTVDNLHTSRCEISSDRKTLKVIDLAEQTNSYYSISGLVLYPITGVVSGVYVAVNNVYHYGEEEIFCSSKKEVTCSSDETITCRSSAPPSKGSDI
ncbi:hypothetical protein ACT3S9_04355 [Pseudoalteromonas sp. AOP31-A2-14]|uniref:hypothetical protein n=1 Tax=Pseudoalteromonas sp. AOP31-A2-14 TaxID=3457695 RepID=UPI003FB8A81D